MSNLRALREQHAYSLADLSRMTGISKAHVHQLEQGTSQPSLVYAARIAAVLDASMNDIWPIASTPFASSQTSETVGPLGLLTVEQRISVARVMLMGTNYCVAKREGQQ